MVTVSSLMLVSNGVKGYNVMFHIFVVALNVWSKSDCSLCKITSSLPNELLSILLFRAAVVVVVVVVIPHYEIKNILF